MFCGWVSARGAHGVIWQGWFWSRCYKWGKFHAINKFYTNWGYYPLGTQVHAKIMFMVAWCMQATPWYNGIRLDFDQSAIIQRSLIFWQMMPHFIRPWYIIHSCLVILLFVILSSHLHQSCDHLCKFVLVFFSTLSSNYAFLQIKTKTWPFDKQILRR